MSAGEQQQKQRQHVDRHLSTEILGELFQSGFVFANERKRLEEAFDRRSVTRPNSRVKSVVNYVLELWLSLVQQLERHVQSASYVSFIRRVSSRSDRVLHCVSNKNHTDVAHYNFNVRQPILVILAEMLLREYAIKRWFVIPLLPTNVSALLRKIVFFSHAVYCVSKTKWLGEK